MRFIWKLVPRPLLESQQPDPGPDVVPGNKEAKEHKKDLKPFLDRYEKMPQAKKQEILDKAKKWYYQQDINQLKKAGVSAEDDEKDYMQKHALLAAAFMEREKNSPQLKFKVDFKGNQLAEYNVGAADLLPPTASVIRIYNDTGSIVTERAFRAVNPSTGRIGYYDEKIFKDSGRYSYIPVFSGFEIEVLETLDESNPALQRRVMLEHIENYQRGPRTPKDNYSPEGLPAGHLATVTESQQKRESTTGGSIDENLSSLSGGLDASHALAEARRTIALTARKYVGVVREEFRSNDVAGGKLACVKVATTILKEAGYLDQIMLHVDSTASELLRRGWTYAEDKPEPGDVIVWAPTQRLIEGSDINNPRYEPGHKHIGIAVGPNRAVSNNSKRGMPTEHDIYTGRPVEAILKPPKNIGKKPEAAAARPASSATEYAHHTSRDLGVISADHKQNAAHLSILPATRKRLGRFVEKVMQNRARYEHVSQATGIPWELIAALHERESGCNFKTYLHNGDPLGKPTVHVPKGKLFYDWETAAIDALGIGKLGERLGISANTKDTGKLLAFAEAYNGLGYRKQSIGKPSPYVYAGTNIYQGGKYVADGVYDPNAMDRQLGVAAMLTALRSTPETLPQESNRAVV